MEDMNNRGYLVVTDTVAADGKTDVADQIQKLIDENPNRTIYFPDGVYVLSHPILTPADPKKSVDLKLSNYAVLKAADGWSSEQAMVRLGGMLRDREGTANAREAAKWFRKAAELGNAKLEDFPLLMHVDEIITQKKPVSIPWEDFTFKFNK